MKPLSTLTEGHPRSPQPNDEARWRRAVSLLSWSVAAVAVLGPAASWDAAQTLQPRGALTERFYASVPVGGAVLVGVRAHPASGHIDPNNLWAIIPAPSERLLCVSLVSPDGRYQGSAEYDIAAVRPGRYRLALPTHFAPVLRGFAAQEFGAFAVEAPSCDALALARLTSSNRGAVAVVLAWGPDESVDSVAIHVQTDQTSAVVHLEGSPSRQIPCRPATGPSIVVFDAVCVVPLAHGAAVRLHLERWHIQDLLDTQALVIWLP